VIHNAAGYFFGYWLSRLFGMDKILVKILPLKGLQQW
jgi:predicted Na+-dependent transporter